MDSARAQTYSNLEIIVSDNASSDGTWNYLQSIDDPRLVLRRNTTNLGGVANLNACLAAATGELFLLLSDDDLLETTMIEELIRPFLDRDNALKPDIGLVWCNCKIIDTNGDLKWVTAAGPSTEAPASLLTALFSGKRGPRLSSVAIRTEDARRVGGYNQDRYNAMCDTANWGAACLAYPAVACIAKPLVSYRVHDASHTAASRASDWQLWGSRMHEDLLAVLQQYGTPAEIRLFVRSRDSLLANLTVDVLMRGKGNSGWIPRAFHEVWRSRRFMLTPYVFRRALVDGMKLLRSK